MSDKIKCLDCKSTNITVRVGELVDDNDYCRVGKHYRCSNCRTGWIETVDDEKHPIIKVNF